MKERTDRLLQSEKVATMGALLAGVAHELNNPLAALLGQAQLLRETTTDPKLVERTEKINRAADRCVRIVRNFLTLARQHRPERVPTALASVIEGAVELLAYELRTEEIEVAIDVEPGLPRFIADPHQLHQVLVNLLANAQHAMRRQARPKRLRISGRRDAARDSIVVTVADSGPGIPPSVLDRIFEAFFTTKPAGEGTGLGLSLCRTIVEDHGGTISAESTVGEGTTFMIELPALAAPSPPAAPGGGGPGRAAQPRAILVVDDEEDVAAVIAEALALEGHQTEVATNGVMALRALALGRFDLVVSDTKMPIMDGEMFFTEAARRHPGLAGRFIFLTGDVLSREKREFLERAGAPYLTKPCDLAEVRRLVQQVGDALDGGGRSA